MPSAFRELELSDAQVTEVVIRGDEVLVHLLDWQERSLAVTFGDVIGIEEFGVIGVDLSHAGESTDDPVIQKACRLADVSPEDYHGFSLFSAWTDEPLLQIVARRFLVSGN